MSDEESTHEIDIDALRDSLAAARDGDPRAPMIRHAPAREDLVDLDDVEDGAPSYEGQSLIGTIPAHDVAQALREMMVEIPDFSERPHAMRLHAEALERDEARSDTGRGMGSPFGRRWTNLDEGDTQTRLPDGMTDELPPAPAPAREERGDEEEPAPQSDDALPSFALDDSDDDAPPAPWPVWNRRPAPVETVPDAREDELESARDDRTGITRAVHPDQMDEIRARLEMPETTVIVSGSLPDSPHDRPTSISTPLNAATDEMVSLSHATADDFPHPDALPREELPRFSMASLSSISGGTPSNPEVDVPASLPDFPERTLERPSVSAPNQDPFEVPTDVHGEPASPLPATNPQLKRGSSPSLPSIDVRVSLASIYDDDAPVDEILDADFLDDVEIVEDDQTEAGIRVARPGPTDAVDEEEAELLAAARFGPLIAMYRQRLASTEGPNKRAALILRISSAYETGLLDANQAFLTAVEALETAPANEEVIAAADRIAVAAGRVGELAEKVKRTLLPGATDDKRVVWLGHLIYWYERVLGRGSEVKPLVAEIERLDKVHPVVLKRAAQIAAMNGDVKSQREHLRRALERAMRSGEKVAIHLQLASAYAGTPDALRNYEAALFHDPTSIVALQGVKRLGKEKEQYAQMQWALERQAEVAPTEAERIDALLELAELQESKFLKRELAAELLERVLTLEPAQPSALKALERCYHALRDWPKLARILGIRAEHTYDKKSKVQLFELAAEVHESKLGDLEGALEVYGNLLLVEPMHRRALGDVARISEKLGDWAKVAAYKARLAELATTKRGSSQELVKLGDFLNVPERDPTSAKLQYEQAVAVDPTNAAGWEALQRIALSEGDDHRMVTCLEKRNEHTDVPRQRAVILVELATVHLRLGDRASAQTAFEGAIHADASNEAAAIAMLDTYTAQERWAEAAPLCELLVNAAIRDRDTEALFIRLRLATRIAAALGDADRAVTSAMAALDARPDDKGAQADLVAVCSQSAPAAKRATLYLAAIAAAPDDLSGDMLLRLASMQRDAGDLDPAAALFERARKLDPENHDITRELAEIYLTQGDFPRACKLKVALARNATTAEQRFDLFVETGEIWARRAEELEKAATLFEEARAIKPLDPWLLQTLMWLYDELGAWTMLAGVLERVVETQQDPMDRAKTLLVLADLARDKLDDRARAIELLEEVLDLDRKRLDVFEEIVRMLTEDKDWEHLERSYRKMLARVKDDGETQLEFLLFHQVGLIYRDRLGDAARAFDALDAASRLRPEDAEVRKIVVELLVVTDNLDNAVARLREDLERDPLEPQIYAELYELFLRQHNFDKAWCVVNVLARLGTPSPEQQRFHEDYAPMLLEQVPGQIVEQAWRSHVFHPELDPALTSLYAIMTPAVARLRFSQLRPEQRVGRPFTPNHSRMYEAIRTTFDNASEILAIEPPELLVGDPVSPVPFTAALAPYGAFLVSTTAAEAHAASLLYLVGKRLSEQRPELAARAFFPSASDLASLLGTALRVGRNEAAKDASAAALDASFATILSQQERDGIRSIVLQATSEGAALDVQRWSQAADLSSMRAGLLLAGDVTPVRAVILAEEPSASELSAEQKIGELYKFAASDLYSDLRGAIGIAVQD